MRGVPGPRRQPQPDTWLVLAVAIAVVLVTSVPYWLAYRVSGNVVFSGILLNPADGNSYLAKMREGWVGSWLFTLPYTQDPGPGAFIFTYFLFLGHVARWLGLSLEAVYHGARLAGGLALLLTGWAFLGAFAPGRRARWAMWLLFALGSGLGWLALPFGLYTPDLLVPEAFPFLAVFSNAHFALALALELWILRYAVPGLPAAAHPWQGWLVVGLATLALAQVQPMVLLSAGLVIGGVAAWQAVAARSLRPLVVPGFLTFGLLALPWLIYDFTLTLRHPVLAEWNAQNLTPSPPLWAAIIAGGAPLLLAAVGFVRALRRRTPRDVILLAWLGLGGLALYAPFALQRRLSVGLWVPVCVLALDTLRAVVWPRLRPAWRPLGVGVVALLALPTNLLIYAAALGAIAAREPNIFWTAGEAAALRWLGEHATPADTVAAAPTFGLYIPAHTAARVLYGHPFETTHATLQEQLLLNFYAGRLPPETWVHDHRVTYVVVGPRERALLGADWAVDWPVAFAQDEVVIYAP
ncbi:MAG: hypothetical protein IT317_07165 [Anaerolineales bacterium]|nr:hypothetical protein [Anaerolineales bacterium]